MDKTKKTILYILILVILAFLIYTQVSPKDIENDYNSTGLYVYLFEPDDLSNFLSIALDQADYSYKIYEQKTDKKLTKEELNDWKNKNFENDFWNTLPKEYKLVDEGKYELNLDKITFVNESKNRQNATIKNKIIYLNYNGKDLQFEKVSNQPVTFGKEIN